jgi:cullin-associated NEDD8-dissociated protein 1
MIFVSVGAALSSMLEFFQALVQAGLPGLGFRDLISLLRNPVLAVDPNVSGLQLHKQVSKIYIYSLL